MAMIKCPECGKDISDTATSCPNCGYVITKKTVDISPTPVPDLQKKPVAGIVCIVAGIIAVIVGIPLISIIIGIFAIIGGLAMIGLGIKGLTGYAECICPYCRAHGELARNATALRCNSCKKTSVLRDGYLYPVDKV